MASVGENFTFQGGFKGMVDPFNFFHGKKKGPTGPTLQDLLGVIDSYTYKPQYTGQTEKQLYDLFGQLTGTSGLGVEGIPFDIGLPTTGLYDALTRGIKQEYLGTPGGPEGGRIADIRAYYNNAGIPESAINQERLANNDLNSLLTDTAAKINESQKDRLTNVLNIGAGVGSSLYGQNLAQHRGNAQLGLTAAGIDIGVQDSIRQANQQSLNDLLGGVGAVAGTIIGGPGMGTMAGYQAGNQLGSLFSPQPQVSRTGGLYSAAQSSYPNPYGTNYSSVAKLIN
jgi:hypothetical protein